MYSDADHVKWVFRYAVERANFFHHCTAMLPIAIVATAYMNHGDMALAFFGGDTLNLRAMIHKFWGIDFLSRNICMDVKTGSVYVRTTPAS